MFGPAFVAVAIFDVDVGVAEVRESSGSLFGERRDDFDGVDVFDEFGEDSSLVAAASADFEDSISGLRIEAFGHVGDDIGR